MTFSSHFHTTSMSFPILMMNCKQAYPFNTSSRFLLLDYWHFLGSHIEPLRNPYALYRLWALHSFPTPLCCEGSPTTMYFSTPLGRNQHYVLILQINIANLLSIVCKYLCTRSDTKNGAGAQTKTKPTSTSTIFKVLHLEGSRDLS